MRIEKCSFCSCSVYPGHGQQFVRNDCKVFRFCRSKCKKNFGLKRNPLRVKWTRTYRRARQKELTVDTTLAFESKKNIPIRYNRNVTKATVGAMRKIATIREARKAAHWQNRMDEKHEFTERQEVRKLERNISLLSDPSLRSHAEAVISSHKEHKTDTTLPAETVVNQVDKEMDRKLSVKPKKSKASTREYA
ncbi:DNA repair protein [Perkinsela sp. CCAP 1560/4]|nr:DNA repair protein [Perkinsela sp. CCAP 1560/4]|eukprot:KNH09726.1 DNA repair protein [Perkinsela sp. CCAP 1560/4]